MKGMKAVGSSLAAETFGQPAADEIKKGGFLEKIKNPFSLDAGPGPVLCYANPTSAGSQERVTSSIRCTRARTGSDPAGLLF
jgi:hypothetical protein